MRIVIDLQAAQSPNSRHRGIGRYSTSLARHMIRHRGEHDIHIALNGMFADSIAPLREAFREVLPEDHIHVWTAAVPPMPLAGAPACARRGAQLVREAFLASLEPDVVHVASLFENSAYAVTGLHDERWGFRTAVTLYDLIPHIYPDTYLSLPGALEDYQEKVGYLRNADLLLAISAASRVEAIEQLGLPPGKVATISSAVEDHFSPGIVPPGREESLRKQHSLDRPFVLYTGGVNPRKNLEGLVMAWSQLPPAVRDAHQLAIVCAMQPPDRQRLETLLDECGVAQPAVVLTGYVREDDLVDLYRLCKLFVFPSLHEGFGLPALEAMRCGAPVIGANNSSIPEVIGNPDALFDAHTPSSITAKLRQVLEDDDLRGRLARHGLLQADRFSWDASAKAALAAMESLLRDRPARTAPRGNGARKRLALVTPMPPQPSGIADASAQLLPALARHYDIDLILGQPDVTPLPEGSVRAIHSPQWFEDHADEYDRVLHQFGNSEFHKHQFDMLERHAGVVVLHDFFLSGVAAHRELDLKQPLVWTRALYESHGWRALAERRFAHDYTDLIYRYPCNLQVITQATGVIVHSQHAMRLARQWHGSALTQSWRVIPLLRTRPSTSTQRAQARARLGIPKDQFLVCSFGILGPTKLNQRLLNAWRLSALSAASRCSLVFVGQIRPGDEYGERLEADAQALGGPVSITGWVDHDRYQDWLAASDLAVQLRTLSRGETSAAVLDCMNFGVPTIANREGSMADLDVGAVCLLPAQFTDAQLAEALSQLWRDPVRRAAMSARSGAIVHTLHSPATCAAAYADAIESFYAQRPRQTAAGVAAQLLQVFNAETPTPWRDALLRAVRANFPQPGSSRQLFVDVSGWVRGALATGHLPSLLLDLLQAAPIGWRLEPVFFDEPGQTWRYARSMVLNDLSCPADWLADDVIDIRPGDLWSCMPPPGAEPLPAPQGATEAGSYGMRFSLEGAADLLWAAVTGTYPRPGNRHWFVDISELVRRDWGSGIQRVVKNYLLELLLDPPPSTSIVPVYASTSSPGYSIAAQFTMRLAAIDAPDARDVPIDVRQGDTFFGLDLQPQVVPAQAAAFDQMRERGATVAFMLYDLLPIRLHECFYPDAAGRLAQWAHVVARADRVICISQASAADFDAWLDEQGIEHRPRIDSVHLGADLARSLASSGLPEGAASELANIRSRVSFLMVGTLEPRKGHREVLAAFDRLWARGEDVGLVISGHTGWMTESLVHALRTHPELGRRLQWIEDASDEYLAQLYEASACLIAASKGEGFGLPLVEAARRALPIIARDLPVFREIAGEHASYFADDSPPALADSILSWLSLFREKRHPSSAAIRWLSWRESAGMIRQRLLGVDAQTV